MYCAMSDEPTKLTATQAVRLIRAGRLRPMDLMEACLVRIAEREPAVRALGKRVKESFDPKGVLNPGRMWAGA